MRRIFCLNPISKVGLLTLSPNYEVTDTIEQSDAILVRSAQMHEMKLPEKVLAVARAGAGVNNIPIDAYAKSGVVVFNTPGANANAVKELTLAGMFLSARDIFGGMTWLRNNQADPEISKTVEKEKGKFGGTEIFGKTIGIIGLGAIGMMLAKACHALGLKVYGTKRNLESLKHEDLPKDMILVKTKEELLPHCDFISLNLPLSSETKHMMNEEAFKKMKDGVILLNFARDQLVNDEDLKQALLSKKVRAYVTDFPNPATVHMPGVIAIPHLGASTEEAEDNCAVMAIDQIKAYIEQGHLINSVNYPNLDAGEQKGKYRMTILFESRLDLCESLHPYLAKKIVVGSIERKNESYGYAVIDLNSEMSDELIHSIEKIEGILKVRMI